MCKHLKGDGCKKECKSSIIQDEFGFDSGVGMDIDDFLKSFSGTKFASLQRCSTCEKKPESSDKVKQLRFEVDAKIGGKDREIEILHDSIRKLLYTESLLIRQIDVAAERIQALTAKLGTTEKALSELIEERDKYRFKWQKTYDDGQKLITSLKKSQSDLAKKIADKSVASGVAEMIMEVIAPHITEPDATLTNAMQGTIEKILKKAFLDWVSSKPAKKNKAAQKPVTVETQTAPSVDASRKKVEDQGK